MSKTAIKWIVLAAVLGATPVAAQGIASGDNAPAALPDRPRGAPADEYQFVGWCVGVLSTHMQLYVRIKPELDAISQRWDTVEEDSRVYSEQQVAGRDTLALFQRAMTEAEAASPRNLAPEGRAAIQSGVAMWNGLSSIDARNQAYSWMNWELPERCVSAANELEERSKMMSALLVDNSDATADTAAPAARPATSPAPSVAAAPPAATSTSASPPGPQLR